MTEVTEKTEKLPKVKKTFYTIVGKGSRELILAALIRIIITLPYLATIGSEIPSKLFSPKTSRVLVM